LLSVFFLREPFLGRYFRFQFFRIPARRRFFPKAFSELVDVRFGIRFGSPPTPPEDAAMLLREVELKG
jgi:hypothetical protein